MIIKSPPTLHYPIKVTQLLKQRDDEVTPNEQLFWYTYTTKVTEGNELGEEHEVEKTFPSVFESSLGGTITKWLVQKGDQLTGAGIPLVDLEEPCTHEVQFGGMCTICKKDMTITNYNKTTRDTERAPVNMTHSHTALTISVGAARRAEEESKRRLLANKKLTLVVDLDQTIIHATIEPTVAEWQKDPSNPNYEAVKDCKAFQLIDEGPGGGGMWYYIKLRPGLMEFLANISKLYECHIYTMGTRAYAQNIANIVDPDHKIFGDRILSRNENGNMQAKNLSRLFPFDTKMVVIIDDRADVWNYSRNLIRVPVYDFFVGIGDINADLLPKRQTVLSKPRPQANAIKTKAKVESGLASKGNGSSDEAAKLSDLTTEANGTMNSFEQQLVAMSNSDDKLLKELEHKHDEALAAQLVERPLLQKQMLLDKADEEPEKEETSESTQDSEHASHRHTHSLLHDDDDELHFLEASLRRVHQIFYETYNGSITEPIDSRVNRLKGGSKTAKKTPGDIPDVGDLLPDLKSPVLQGITIVFSGLVPLGHDVQTSDIGLWARSFGAEVSEHITKRTTHVIAARNKRTAKVRQAARHHRIKIVTTGWLIESISHWTKADETPHLIQVEPDEYGSQGQSGKTSPIEELEEGSLLSSSDEDTPVTEDDIEAQTNGGDEDEQEQTTPVDISRDDWGEMEAELDEFLRDASDNESEAGSVMSELGVQDDEDTPSSKKRKRGMDSANITDAEDSDVSASKGLGSRLQRKKKRAFERVTSLTNVASARDSQLPSPDTTGPDEDQQIGEGVDGDGGEGNDEFGDEEDDFEAQVMAGMEERSDDEEAEVG